MRTTASATTSARRIRREIDRMHEPPSAPSSRPPVDGWVGTLELPGYRAGNIVVKLDHLPEVDPDHLYFDLLLLDGDGRTQDNHSGPCRAMARSLSLEERSRFVRVVAELLRHIADEPRGLSAVTLALAFIREHGVGVGRLVAAAQMLDEACSARAVTHGLEHMLKLCLGADEARTAMCDVVAGLAQTSGFGALDTVGASSVDPPPADFHRRVGAINDSGLASQVDYVVRTIGKGRARHFLRDATDFHLVPQPEMFGF